MKGGFCTHVYLQGTCHDMHDQSGTNKLTWECFIFNVNCDLISKNLEQSSIFKN